MFCYAYRYTCCTYTDICEWCILNFIGEDFYDFYLTDLS